MLSARRRGYLGNKILQICAWHGEQCSAETFVPSEIKQAVEWMIGAIPAAARTAIVIFIAGIALRKLRWVRDDGGVGGLLANLVVVGRESDESW